MLVDSGVQVWLDTAGSRPAAVTPYVQSEEPGTLRYQVEVSQESPRGRSKVAQSGMVSVSPAEPAALSRFSLTRQAESECRIEITLTSADSQERRFVFDCPF